MGIGVDNDRYEQYSEIGDKPELEFLDYDDDQSLHSYDPYEAGPVIITTPFPFIKGKPRSAFVGQTSMSIIKLTNTSHDPVQLWSTKIYASNPANSYILSLMQPPKTDADEAAVRSFLGSTSLEDRVIQPGESLTIWLSCKPEVIGIHSTIVHFDIDDDRIERAAFLLAEDEISQSLFSNKPYFKKPPQTRKSNYDKYVPGSCPPRKGSRAIKYRLPKYDIPRDIREIIEGKQIPDVVIGVLDIHTYAKFFSTLISMEEIHLEEAMRAHDMQSVTLRRRGSDFLSLELPGLAERRPSLVYGDYIFAQLAAEDAENHNEIFQGYIYRIEADEIYLRFDKVFHQSHRDNSLYDVSFTYNRLNMRRMYQAVYAAEKLGKDFLFPSQLSHGRVLEPFSFIPLNTGLNQEQTHCVQKILGCRGAPPFVIHGPPGTGKTMTLVEAILQVCKASSRARVLVCASSNSASDHVLEKLLEKRGAAAIQDNEILRLNATSRNFADVKTEMIPFCFFEDMLFKSPPFRALLRYKIIISTYMSASLLYAEGIHRGHFTHIFLDEAGQASEPETMIPISNLCSMNTVIVLAGDPMQLGPVIYSKVSGEYGLGKSFLDRLFESKHYENGNENYVIKLVRNYRSHPAILELPSKLFYNGELIACKEEDVSFSYECIGLPSKAFPVLFVGIQGCDEREGSNPSWFNRTEISKVVEIIKKLRQSVDFGDADIGVITPYRQQVLKLKIALESLDMQNLKVGSVEQFQGQERQVIIISTVRSTVKHNEFDRVHDLGFLSNPKRFNVAITRAKSLLVIVGNPHIICKDRHWDRLLMYCVDNDSYQGCALPPPEAHYYPEEETSRSNGQENPAEEETSRSSGQENPALPFRNGEQWIGHKHRQNLSETKSSSVPNQPKSRGNKTKGSSMQPTRWSSGSKSVLAGGNGFSKVKRNLPKWRDYPEYEINIDNSTEYYKDEDHWIDVESIISMPNKYQDPARDGDFPKSFSNKAEGSSVLLTGRGSDSKSGNDYSEACKDQFKWGDYPEDDTNIDSSSYCDDDDMSSEIQSTQYEHKLESGIVSNYQEGPCLGNEYLRTYNNGIEWGGIIIQPSGWGSDDSDKDLAEERQDSVKKCSDTVTGRGKEAIRLEDSISEDEDLAEERQDSVEKCSDTVTGRGKEAIRLEDSISEQNYTAKGRRGKKKMYSRSKTTNIVMHPFSIGQSSRNHGVMNPPNSAV